MKELRLTRNVTNVPSSSKTNDVHDFSEKQFFGCTDCLNKASDIGFPIRAH